MKGGMTLFWATLAVATIVGTSAGDAIVYDNLATSQDGSVAPGEGVQAGDQVTLGGTARELTQLDILYTTGGIATADLQARIYANDGSDGKPGTLLWDSGVLDDVLFSEGDNVVVFQIPNVTVPDTITWAVTEYNVIGPALNLRFYDPPTIGSSGDFLWVNAGSGWYSSDPLGEQKVANLGAAVHAIPEPATLSLVALGGLALLRRKRP
jgi:hypothetical protein